MRSSRWIKEFPEITEIYPSNPDPIVYQMHATLDAFAAGTLPNDEYTFDDLLHFINSLIRRQNGPGKFITWGGNWAVMPTDEGAPSDVRVELVFFPSYLAVSLLTLFWYRYPKQAEEIPDFFTVLHNGLHFITARNLYGHGIEGNEQRDEAVRILLKGKVHHYLQEKRAGSEQCLALYRCLAQFKADYLRSLRFEYLEMIDELKDFPNVALNETPFFSWLPGKSNTGVILEAPYTVSPGREIATKDIVVDVATRTGCGVVIGKVSKQDKRYTGSLSQDNQEIVAAYHRVVKDILNARQDSYGNEDREKQGLHLIIRGMADTHDLDIEVSSRNGRSCDRNLLENIIVPLPWNLERYSRRAYTLSIDSLFGGGSKYLDLIREGYPGRPDLPGFGQSHNVLEIRLSHTIRSMALGKIKDALVRIIEAYEERKYAQ